MVGRLRRSVSRLCEISSRVSLFQNRERGNLVILILKARARSDRLNEAMRCDPHGLDRFKGTSIGLVASDPRSGASVPLDRCSLRRFLPSSIQTLPTIIFEERRDRRFQIEARGIVPRWTIMLCDGGGAIHRSSEPRRRRVRGITSE